MGDVKLIEDKINDLSKKLEEALEREDSNEARAIIRELRKFFEGLLAKEDPYGFISSENLSQSYYWMKFY